MAAYAALVSLINNVDQIMADPRLSTCFVEEQMESLLQKARSLLQFIEGCNHRGLFTQEAEDLEREITAAAHAAEDVVESHVVDQIHAGTLRSLDLQQVVQDMVAVAVKAMEVKAKEGAREEVEQPPITHPTPPVESGGTAMVGLDDESTHLLDMLTDHNPKRHVISIVGMGGTGKTTLAQNIYAREVVKEHFDIRAWAIVSQQYNLLQILSQLLSCFGKSTEGKVGELGESLHKTLYGRRYLIVLDDIWDIKAWDEVRRYLPEGDDRSRVVLTTRLSNVASLCSYACVDINLLNDEKSWKLFCEKTLFPHKDDPLQLEDVAKEIVKSCKGLALSIVVIGGLLLKSPRTVGYWENVLKDLEANDSKEKQQGLDALSLSYNHLPPHLKPCFLYLGHFKEDSRIRVSNVTKLWVAEGFIKPKGSRVLEEIAEGYLKDLSDRNLILGVEHRLTEKMKSFSIHDLLRDLCVRFAEQQQFFHVRKCGEIQGTERRLVYDPHQKKIGNALLRSILGQNYFLEYANCKLMRVLDATYNESSTTAYENANLRYLADLPPSDRGDVVELPASACLLWNLQSLILKRKYWCSELVVVPREFWKMRRLRHFECDQVYLPDPPPRRRRDGQDKMEDLQTLRRAVNLRLSEEVCEMIPNIKKLHLVYEPKKQGYDDSLIECLSNLDRLQKLDTLNLQTDSRWVRRKSKLTWKLAFPLSLTKLCLSECKLSWEDMSIIGSLPQLQVLRLLSEAFEGIMWTPMSGQFLRLKLLEIELCYICLWVADSSHFPVLEKLLLRDLCFLKEIPLEIGEISTLELIRVKGNCESAAISAVKIKKDQLENYDNDALQIEVVVRKESRMESFKKRVEAEELELSLFKLQI